MGKSSKEAFISAISLTFYMRELINKRKISQYYRSSNNMIFQSSDEFYGVVFLERRYKRIKIYFCHFFRDLSRVDYISVNVDRKPLFIHIDLHANNSLAKYNFQRQCYWITLAVYKNICVSKMITHKEGVIVGLVMNNFFDILATYSNKYVVMFGLKNFNLKEMYSSFRKQFSIIIDEMKIFCQHFYPSSSLAYFKHVDMLVCPIWFEVNPLRSQLPLHPRFFIIYCLKNRQYCLEPFFLVHKSSLRKGNVQRQFNSSFFVGDFKRNQKFTINNTRLLIVFDLFEQFLCILEEHKACSLLLNELVSNLFQVYPPS